MGVVNELYNFSMKRVELKYFDYASSNCHHFRLIYFYSFFKFSTCLFRTLLPLFYNTIILARTGVIYIVINYTEKKITQYKSKEM